MKLRIALPALIVAGLFVVASAQRQCLRVV